MIFTVSFSFTFYFTVRLSQSVIKIIMMIPMDHHHHDIHVDNLNQDHCHTDTHRTGHWPLGDAHHDR